MLVQLPPASCPLYQVAQWGYIIMISLVIKHITTKTTQPLFITIEDIYCQITWYTIIANAEEGVVAYLKLLTWSRNKQQKDKYKVYYGHIVWMWKKVEHTSEVTRVLALPRYLQHSSLETERWELEASYATSLLLLSGQCSASLAPTETCRHTSAKLTLMTDWKSMGLHSTMRHPNKCPSGEFKQYNFTSTWTTM